MPHLNLLKAYRKRSVLSLIDIAYLMNHTDQISLCRYEKELRPPSLEVMLVYHLLFETSVESFFQKRRHEVRDQILARIPPLINALRERKATDKIQRKIAFLEEVLTRLTSTRSV